MNDFPRPNDTDASADAARAAATMARRHRKVALACTMLVAAMTGAAFAAVPLYDWFCRTTGYGGTTNVAKSAPIAPIERMIEVRFDANIRGLPWSFKPETDTVKVRVGEVMTVNYVIENTTDQPTAGIASYNVTPEETGFYFNKMVCFCFTQQTLGPRERMVAPVTFFVDPEIDKIWNLKAVKTITLSYTFFPEAGTQPVATNSAASAPPKTLN